MSIKALILFACALWCIQGKTFDPEKNVVYAINCGGNAFVDSQGIKYRADDLEVGIISHHGSQMRIDRVLSPGDAELYQTERYHTDSLTYTLPLAGDGRYVLWLKFSEVFNVVLNKEIRVVEDLDIFALVGKAAAHDEYIAFEITNNGKAIVHDASKRADLVTPNSLLVTFEKTDYDNPKINAIVLAKDVDPEDLPHLLPIEIKPDEEDDDFFSDEATQSPNILQHQRPASSKPFKFADEEEDEEDELSTTTTTTSSKFTLPVIVAITVGLISMAFLVQKL